MNTITSSLLGILKEDLLLEKLSVRVVLLPVSKVVDSQPNFSLTFVANESRTVQAESSGTINKV